MDAFNVFRTGIRVVTVEICVGADIDCLSSVNDLAELWAQLRVSCVTRGPEGVSSDGWDGVVVEMGDPSWLFLMDKITTNSVLTKVWEKCSDLTCAISTLRLAVGKMPSSQSP